MYFREVSSVCDIDVASRPAERSPFVSSSGTNAAITTKRDIMKMLETKRRLLYSAVKISERRNRGE